MTLLSLLSLCFALDPTLPIGTGPTAPSGPQAVAEAGVVSLDFLQGTDRSQLVIGVRGTFTPIVTADAARIVLSLPGATLGGGLDRPLDTSHFPSPITEVDADATSAGVTITLRLRAPATWSIDSAQAGLLVLDVIGSAPRPPFSALGPSSSDQPAFAPTPAPTFPTPRFTTGDPPAWYPFVTPTVAAIQAKTAAVRVNLDLEDAEVQHVIRLLGELGGINFVIDEDVKGTVTVHFKDIAWDEALGAILASEGLSARTVGDTTLQISGK